MKNTKLKNNLIICGVIAAAFIVAVVIYFVFDDKDVSLNTNEYSESLSLRGDLTASLIWNTKGIYPKYSEEYDYYYNKDKILVSDMDEDILLNLVLHRLDRLGELNDGIIEESLVKEEYKNRIIEAKNTLLSMKGMVPTVIDINVGIDLLHSERSYDIILEVIVESMEHLDIYQKDLYHCTVVKPLMHEIRSASVAVDYEVE